MAEFTLIIRPSHHEDEIAAILKILLSQEAGCAASTLAEVTAVFSLLIGEGMEKLNPTTFLSNLSSSFSRYRAEYEAQVEAQQGTLQ